MDTDQLVQEVARAMAQALQQQQRPQEVAAALNVDLRNFSGRQEYRNSKDWRTEYLAEDLTTQEDPRHQGRS